MPHFNFSHRTSQTIESVLQRTKTHYKKISLYIVLDHY